MNDIAWAVIFCICAVFVTVMFYEAQLEELRKQHRQETEALFQALRELRDKIWKDSKDA